MKILPIFFFIFVSTLSHALPSFQDTAKMTLSFTGDLMVHYSQLVDAKQEDGSYNFHNHFDIMRPYFSRADICAANFETTVSTPEMGYDGYPLFKTPPEFVDALKLAGFDLLTTSNNHSYDNRYFGVEKTIDTLKEKGFFYTGTWKDKKDWGKPCFTTVNGITVAHFAFTNSVNGNEWMLGKEAPNHVARIDQSNFISLITPIVNEAKAKSDFMIVYAHWGSEYVNYPNNSQRYWAKQLIELGFDLIIGSHPHVLQPYEVLKSDSGKEVPVIWSMGNVISNMDHNLQANTDVGLLFSIELTKDYTAFKTSITQKEFQPFFIDIFVHPEKKGEKYNRGYKILPLFDLYPAHLNEIHPLSEERSARYKEAYQFYQKLFPTVN